jgi:3-phosphoshikimate 1-carboxyvinyltransferase
MLGSLAEGASVLRKPLLSSDTEAAIDACSLFGAGIVGSAEDWAIRGFGGVPQVPDDVIDVGNSGTSLYMAMGLAALCDGSTVLTGDDQIRRRPAAPLIEALNVLGAAVESTRDNGCAPIIVHGRLRGGSVQLDGSKTSQYLSSLLIACPVAQRDSLIEVDNLVEKPYVEMTLRWLADCGVCVECEDYHRFKVPGRQRYKRFEKTIPADFSSATFFLVAAAITGASLTLKGLDMTDSQADKVVVDMLESMGCRVERGASEIRIAGGSLTGARFDLGDCPDALPAMAVAGCFAEGETRLVNVAQARLKETDRIAVMCHELRKMGADIEETIDGLVIRRANLHGAEVNGHMDHRVVMALAVAGLRSDGETIIDTAEAVDVTFPTFVELMTHIGAHMRTVEEDQLVR